MRNAYAKIFPSYRIVFSDLNWQEKRVNAGWQATLTVPGVPERQYDFSSVGVALELPFVNNISWPAYWIRLLSARLVLYRRCRLRSRRHAVPIQLS